MLLHHCQLSFTVPHNPQGIEAYKFSFFVLFSSPSFGSAFCSVLWSLYITEGRNKLPITIPDDNTSWRYILLIGTCSIRIHFSKNCLGGETRPHICWYHMQLFPLIKCLQFFLPITYMIYSIKPKYYLLCKWAMKYKKEPIPMTSSS